MCFQNGQSWDQKEQGKEYREQRKEYGEQRKEYGELEAAQEADFLKVPVPAGPLLEPKIVNFCILFNFFSHVFSHRLQDPSFIDFASILARFSGLFEHMFL